MLEPEVFEYCSGLTTLTIPNGVTTIGEGAFRNCYGLTQVSIPSTLETIEQSAFDRCDRLKRIDIEDLEAWLKINGIDNLLQSSSSDNMIYLNGEQLVDVVIPETIEHIPSSAFYGVGSIKSVFVPATVKSLGWYPFDHIYGVQVKFESNVPPTIDTSRTFYRFEGTVLVPSSSVEVYEIGLERQWWMDFPIVGY